MKKVIVKLENFSKSFWENDKNDPNDEKAIKLLQELYPDGVIEPIYAREILLGGGNIHCITQQVPMNK